MTYRTYFILDFIPHTRTSRRIENTQQSQLIYHPYSQRSEPDPWVSRCRSQRQWACEFPRPTYDLRRAG